MKITLLVRINDAEEPWCLGEGEIEGRPEEGMRELSKLLHAAADAVWEEATDELE